jgi:hypothetical protein
MKKRILFIISLLLVSCNNQQIYFASSLDSSSFTFSSAPSSLSSIIENSSSILSTNSTQEVSSSLEISSSSSEEEVASNDEYIPTFDNKNTVQMEEYAKNGYASLYQDNKFHNGFIVSRPLSSDARGPHYKEYLYHYQQAQGIKPTWTLAQWGTRHDLYEEGYTSFQDDDDIEYGYVTKGGTYNEDGEFIPAKKIKFNASDGSLYMEINGQSEYDEARTTGSWPAFLLSQTFNDNLINISSLESLVMEASLQVTKFDDLMGSTAIASKHAAQVVWYITLQNRNKKSSEYGKYIWFGIELWDNRYQGKNKTLFSQIDNGTSSLMYNISSVYYYKDNYGFMPQFNQKVCAKVEVLNFSRLAYQHAIETGFFQTTQYEDLYVGSTNFGFEIPGTYNIGTKFYAINVFYK